MERIAILAGGGRLPLVLADSIASRGGRAHIVAVKGEAGPEVEAYPHTWVTWGEVNAILATLKRESNGTMMIAGNVSRPDLRRLKPDLGLIRYLPQVLSMLKGGDDAVLTRLIRFFEMQGLTVKGISDVAPELLAQAGQLGAPVAHPHQAEGDTTLGFRVLDTLADLDVGQAIAVARGRILAIEGVEGTDRMLQRIKTLCGHHTRDGVVVKGPKSGQDLRVDVPTVGAQTIERLADAGIGTLVIVAGKTLLLERTDMVRRAIESGIVIDCLDRKQSLEAAGLSRQRRREALMQTRAATMLGRLVPNTTDSYDARMAVEVTQRLRPYGAGRAAAVVRDHVLAVAAAEGPVEMAKRVATLRQWGRRRTGRGAAAITFDVATDDPADVTAMIEALDGAGLAGVAVVCPPSPLAAHHGNGIPASAIAAADNLKLFLIEIAADQAAPAIEVV